VVRSYISAYHIPDTALIEMYVTLWQRPINHFTIMRVYSKAIRIVFVCLYNYDSVLRIISDVGTYLIGAVE